VRETGELPGGSPRCLLLDSGSRSSTVVSDGATTWCSSPSPCGWTTGRRARTPMPLTGAPFADLRSAVDGARLVLADTCTSVEE